MKAAIFVLLTTSCGIAPDKLTDSKTDTNNQPVLVLSHFMSEAYGLTITSLKATEVNNFPEVGFLKLEMEGHSETNNCHSKSGYAGVSIQLTLLENTVAHFILEPRFLSTDATFNPNLLTSPCPLIYITRKVVIPLNFDLNSSIRKWHYKIKNSHDYRVL